MFPRLAAPLSHFLAELAQRMDWVDHSLMIDALADIGAKTGATLVEHLDQPGVPEQPAAFIQSLAVEYMQLNQHEKEGVAA